MLLTAQETIDTAQTNSEVQVNFKPKFRGTIRARGENDITESEGRFNVRNARAIVSGNANSWISYQMQVDLSDNGDFRVLDADIRLAPVNNITITVGQTFIPFNVRHAVTPGTTMFANRALAHKHMGAGNRDIGVVANYRHLWGNFPINFSAAVFNGEGINKPVWDNNVGYAFRVMFGTMDYVQYSLKTYQTDAVSLFSADFYYFNNGMTLETELMFGNYRPDGPYKEARLAWYLQAGQILDTDKQNKNRRVKYIEPIARWDMMGLTNANVSDAHRMTLGVNFGLDKTYRKAELRLNYEKYIVKGYMTGIYFGENSTVWHDKVTLELLLNIN
jgi:hypothetical protein